MGINEEPSGQTKENDQPNTEQSLPLSKEDKEDEDLDRQERDNRKTKGGQPLSFIDQLRLQLQEDSVEASQLTPQDHTQQPHAKPQKPSEPHIPHNWVSENQTRVSSPNSGQRQNQVHFSQAPGPSSRLHEDYQRHVHSGRYAASANNLEYDRRHQNYDPSQAQQSRFMALSPQERALHQIHHAARYGWRLHPDQGWIRVQRYPAHQNPSQYRGQNQGTVHLPQEFLPPQVPQQGQISVASRRETVQNTPQIQIQGQRHAAQGPQYYPEQIPLQYVNHEAWQNARWSSAPQSVRSNSGQLNSQQGAGKSRQQGLQDLEFMASQRAQLLSEDPLSWQKRVSSSENEGQRRQVNPVRQTRNSLPIFSQSRNEPEVLSRSEVRSSMPTRSIPPYIPAMGPILDFNAPSAINEATDEDLVYSLGQEFSLEEDDPHIIRSEPGPQTSPNQDPALNSNIHARSMNRNEGISEVAFKRTSDDLSSHFVPIEQALDERSIQTKPLPKLVLKTKIGTESRIQYKDAQEDEEDEEEENSKRKNPPKGRESGEDLPQKKKRRKKTETDEDSDFNVRSVTRVIQDTKQAKTKLKPQTQIKKTLLSKAKKKRRRPLRDRNAQKQDSPEQPR